MRKANKITELVRDLRRNQTQAEEILWKELKAKKLGGFKFLRQQPIYYYSIGKRKFFFIADFYCSEKNLVIELDGKIHEQQKEYDEQRDIVISEKGIKVLRFKNEELSDMPKVLNQILENLK